MNMKNVSIALLVTLGLSTSFGPLYASAPHDHSHDIMTGPKGGKLLEVRSEHIPHIELFVNQSGKVELTLLDIENQPIPLQGHIVEVTVGSRLNSRRVPVEKSGNDFVTSEKLAGDQPIQLTIQIKESPKDSPKTVRTTIDTHICGECGQPEYICTCHHTH